MTKVIYYTTDSGKNPTLDFIRSLNEKQQRKMMRILTTVETYGLVTAIPHIKKLIDSPLWEIRILGQDNIRVLYVTKEQDMIIILHGFIKKTQKTPLKEIRVALQRLKEMENVK